jgi:hypothetical protein
MSVDLSRGLVPSKARIVWINVSSEMSLRTSWRDRTKFWASGDRKLRGMA